MDEGGGGWMVPLKPLLIRLTPTTHSKPTRAIVPGGVSVGTSVGGVSVGTSVGGVGGGLASTTKPGDPLSSPSVAAL